LEISNPSNYDTEMYLLETDKQYLEEEKMIQDYDKLQDGEVCI